MHNLTRITFNPEVMGGKPCIRGMRVTVGAIVGLVASGKTVDEVLADYPYLERVSERISWRHCHTLPGGPKKEKCQRMQPETESLGEILNVF